MEQITNIDEINIRMYLLIRLLVNTIIAIKQNRFPMDRIKIHSGNVRILLIQTLKIDTTIDAFITKKESMLLERKKELIYKLNKVIAKAVITI